MCCINQRVSAELHINLNPSPDSRTIYSNNNGMYRTGMTMSNDGASENNLSRQADEVEALSSIYDTSFKIEDGANRSYSISVTEGSDTATLYFQLLEEYPSLAPPTYQISAPWLKGADKLHLSYQLENIYLEHVGETIIFQWTEKLRDFLQIRTCKSEEQDTKSGSHEHLTVAQDSTVEPCQVPSITHGETTLDRKSSFQGHVATVKSLVDVKAVLQSLYSNRKVANATHNIYAYRISRGTCDSYLQDCEDDGETQAGSRLLHLLQILNLSDVLVVVSRWYGGIHLGPDRFRHINNAARHTLQLAGLLPTPPNAQHKTKPK